MAAADKAPRRLRHGEDFNTVFDRFLSFLKKLFIAVKCAVEKLLTQVDASSLPLLWYNHLGDRETRQKIYEPEEVVEATEASHDLMSIAFKKLIVA